MAIPRGVSRRLQVQLNTTAGAAHTGAAPTVVITKDGGVQTAATNAATHKGGGQWELVATAAEMTADEVSAQFSAAGVVPAVVTVYPDPAVVAAATTSGIPPARRRVTPL